MQGEEPFLIWSCRRDHYPVTAIIPVSFWKKSHASVHSHSGCEQFVPPAEKQCLAVVPHLHFTSVFGAISSNLSKSFWILTLSPKCPCHPSPITLVCMHNNPAPSSLTVSSIQTKWSKDRRTCSPAVHAAWEPLDAAVLQGSAIPFCACLGPRSFHCMLGGFRGTKTTGQSLVTPQFVMQHHQMAVEVARQAEGLFPGRPPLLCSSWLQDE